jgi:hypothetical protein
MPLTDHDARSHYHHPRPQHEAYYARRDQPTATAARETPAAMRHSERPSRYSYDAPAHASSYEPRAPPLPRRSAAPPQHHDPRPQEYAYAYPSPSAGRRRKHTWPPSPSVEDEAAALAQEAAPSRGPRAPHADGEPPVDTRGTVDQEALLEDIEPDPADDRRYVLLSEPSASPSRDRRRKSIAERGNMAPIKTDVEDPPVYTERVSTPYAYTKPQRESTAPSRADLPYRPPPAPKDDVFDDSDADADDTTHLRTAERKPARYSFVKTDLQKEDLRTNLREAPPRPESRRREARQRSSPTFQTSESSGSTKDNSYTQSPRSPPTFHKNESSGSAKDNQYAHSPRSSSSSINSGGRKSRPAPVDTGNYYSSSRTPSRPSSPVQRAPSPKLPSRRRETPSSSRPSSRGNTRPASPLSFSTILQPPSPGRAPVMDADWHATYPPAPTLDRSRPPSRMTRYDTMPEPGPRIDIHSPSPARPPVPSNPLPYPVDDQPLGIFMPAEQNYQYDHSTAIPTRQTFPESPGMMSSPIPGSPRLRDEVWRPKSNINVSEEPSRTRRTRSNSVRSQTNVENRREQPAKFDLDKPLPDCRRTVPTSKYDDWYTLKGCSSFDICPGCFDGVFAGTPFAEDFSQIRRGERPTERFCDFSSPWTRLAWLLTIKQRRSSPELLYKVADVADNDRPCPDDRELSSDRVTWYGIPDQRDGIHVANFAICASDKKMIEALLPTLRGYFTRLPSTYSSSVPQKHMCSLRTSSRRFPKYVDLLVELDTDAQDLSQRPAINRFVQMARDNAFKGECAKDKAFTRKPWLFIPSLPEFTVCEECYDELVWPACQSKSTPNTIPRLFNKSLQLVPNEDPEIGSSCCLYSSRMRRVFDTAVRDADFSYLKRKAVERKRAENKLSREKKGIVKWMAGLERGSSQWEHAKSEMKAVEREWAIWE